MTYAEIRSEVARQLERCSSLCLDTQEEREVVATLLAGTFVDLHVKYVVARIDAENSNQKAR